MQQDWLPTDPWLPASAPLTSGSACRSAGLMDTIVAQFAVSTHPRYRARDIGGGPTTFCNIFLSDATKALGCPIPHVDLLPRGGWGELDANACIRWVANVGPRHGWQPIGADAVTDEVDKGCVAIATWLHPGGIGHVALVAPAFGAVGPILITQAGARNFEREPVTHGFSNLPVAYFVHA